MGRDGAQRGPRLSFDHTYTKVDAIFTCVNVSAAHRIDISECGCTNRVSFRGAFEARRHLDAVKEALPCVLRGGLVNRRRRVPYTCRGNLSPSARQLPTGRSRLKRDNSRGIGVALESRARSSPYLRAMPARGDNAVPIREVLGLRSASCRELRFSMASRARWL